MTRLPVLESPLSVRVRQITAQLRNERNSHMKLSIAKQKDPTEAFFSTLMVEDRVRCAVAPGFYQQQSAYLCSIA